jgi:hypothetical protein
LADSVVVRSRVTDAITQYPLERRGRRAQIHLKQTGQVIPMLPSNSVPLDPPQETRRHWALSPNAGQNVIPALLPSLPPTSFQDYVSLSDPALRALVSDVEFLRPFAEIAQLLKSTTTLTLVGDGGAKTCRGSYGAIAALDSVRILRLMGPITGPDPRSYRAEAHAMAAITISVVILHQVLSHQVNHYSAMEVFSDNQGLVDTITKMMEWNMWY